MKSGNDVKVRHVHHVDFPCDESTAEESPGLSVAGPFLRLIPPEQLLIPNVPPDAQPVSAPSVPSGDSGMDDGNVNENEMSVEIVGEVNPTPEDPDDSVVVVS